MDASDGAVAAQFCAETQRTTLLGATRAASAVETAFCEEKRDVPSPPTRKKDMEGESYSSKSVFAGEEQMGSSRMNTVVEESYGSSRFLADEEGVSAQNNIVGGDESYESRRFLLSCSMASARVKKKRRSRASSKTPIKVFSTDTSNFMAMVHKLTGIPSNASPFHSTLPSPWSPKILPFSQGLATLDTSALFLPTLSCDRALSGSGYSGMQALPPQQQLSSVSSGMKTTIQAGQPPASLDCMSASYSDLMRSISSNINSSSLPRLWEASYTSQKSAAHQLQQNSFNEKEGISRHEPSHQQATMEVNIPTSNNNTRSRLEILLGGHDKISSSTNVLTGCIAKEELL